MFFWPHFVQYLTHWYHTANYTRVHTGTHTHESDHPTTTLVTYRMEKGTQVFLQCLLRYCSCNLQLQFCTLIVGDDYTCGASRAAAAFFPLVGFFLPFSRRPWSCTNNYLIYRYNIHTSQVFFRCPGVRLYCMNQRISSSNLLACIPTQQ